MINETSIDELIQRFKKVREKAKEISEKLREEELARLE